MRTRHTPMSAKLTEAHFHAEGAQEPWFDQDGNVIYTPSDAQARELHVVDQWIAALQANTPRRAHSLRYQGNSVALHERREAEDALVGRWYRREAHKSQREHGTYAAALVMRALGVPLHVALLTLA